MAVNKYITIKTDCYEMSYLGHKTLSNQKNTMRVKHTP